MSKKRTRKDKLKAQQRKAVPTSVSTETTADGQLRYSLESSESSKQVKLVVPETQQKTSIDLHSFFGYEPKLITKDLVRTLISTVIIFGLLGVIVYLQQ